MYCDEAYAERAEEDADFRNQYKELLSGLLCTEFASLPAEVVCEECCDIFSSSVLQYVGLEVWKKVV